MKSKGSRIDIMNEEIMTIDANRNSGYGAVIHIDPEIWENKKEKYRWDIVKQKNGTVIDTVEINYADSIDQAVANAIYAIKQRGSKNNGKKIDKYNKSLW